METRIALVEQSKYKFPLSKALGAHIEAQINEVGGAAQTCFLDEMGLNRTRNPIKRASVALAQIDDIENAIFENAYRRKWVQLLLRYYKLLKFFIPNFLGGDLLKLKIDSIEAGLPRTEKLFLAAMIRKENYIRKYKELEDLIGPITRENIEKHEARSHMMDLCEQAICSTMERGTPKEGQFLYASELKKISKSQLRKEIMAFCLVEKDDGEVEIRDTTLEQEELFLVAMADKYCGTS